jgi:hypothetical protein
LGPWCGYYGKKNFYLTFFFGYMKIFGEFSRIFGEFLRIFAKFQQNLGFVQKIFDLPFFVVVVKKIL